MDTQTQIDRLIELAIIQRSELKQLVEQLPQLREHLNAEVEKVFDETEPQLRAELEEWTTKQTADKTAALGVTLEAKIADLAKSLEVSTQARYNAIIAERDQNARLAAQAEAKIAEHAASLPSAVKDIVTAELARFPRAGEIDQLRKEFAEPRGLNPRGKWQAGETYNKLDLVTINGDSYTSNTDGNRTRPSRSSADWTLVAARGTGGGGGPTSLAELTTVPSDGDLLIGSGTSWVTSNLTAGAGISITVGPGAITISATDGDITLDDGTAASPSLHFTNDPDTGIYRPAANTLGISTSGVQRMYVDENGITTVGAGGTFDGSVHAANGNANNPSFSFTSDQDTGFYRHGTNELGISIGGTEKAVMTSTTFTITPNLVVSGTGSINGTSIPASKTLVVTTDKLSALASTSSSELAGVISDETGTGALVFANTPTLTTPNIGAATGTSFNLTGSGTLGTTLTVNSTTDSSSKDTGAIVTEGGLGVEKSATIGGNLTVSGTGTSSVAGNFLIGQGTAVTSGARNYLTIGGTLLGSIALKDSSDASAAYFQVTTTGAELFSNTGKVLVLGSNGGEQARFTTSGNVLIGTTTDGGQKLQVSGSGFISGSLAVGDRAAPAGVSLRVQQAGSDDVGLEWQRTSATNGILLSYNRASSAYTSMSYGASSHTFTISGTTALTLDSSQNATFAGKIGIGVSPSSWNLNLQQSAIGSAVRIISPTALGLNDSSIYIAWASGSKAVISASYESTGSYRPLVLSTGGVDSLTLDTSGNATFAKGQTVGGTIQITATTSPSSGSGMELQGGASPTIFNYNRTGSAYLPFTVFASTFDFKIGPNTAFGIDAASNTTFAGNIKTAAPSGGTAATWRLGTVASVSPTSPNRTIEVQIGGTTYYIHAKTTND